MRRVTLELTEIAIGLQYAAFSTHASVPEGRVPRIPKATLGALYGPSPDQLRAQAVYLRSVSIVEAYIDSLSTSLFADHGRSRDSLFERLAAIAQEQSENSWEARRSNFKAHHGVGLGDMKTYSDIERAVVVRNAIAHGLGALTKRQRNPKDRAKVQQVGVQLSDDRIVIPEAALDKLRSSAVLFIRDVDEALPHRPLFL